MSVADARREAILDRLADYMLSRGLAASSLRPLARAARTSDRMLLYYFEDKAALIAATLDRLAARLTALLEQGAASTPMPADRLRSRLQSVLFSEPVRPYMRLWLEVVALASRNDPFYRKVGERIGRAFHAWVLSQIKSATPAQAEQEAAQLLVVLEGTLLLSSVGLEDLCKRAYSL